MRKIFFNSSMPRSGSTLLQNILGNRPDFYATPTSPLFDYLHSSRESFSRSIMVKAQDTEVMKTAFLNYCRFGLEGFFNGITDKDYVIDKSRLWGINREFVNSFYPNPKIVCMVRDLRDILSSMENNYRKNPHLVKENASENYNILIRVSDWLMNSSKPVGVTLSNLQELIHRGYDKNILFVKYEDLCCEPKKTMEKVHDYLEISFYEYDFCNIKQVTFEDDKFHGIYGDHKIKSKVESKVSVAKDVLGSKICDAIYERHKWYFKYFNYEK